MAKTKGSQKAAHSVKKDEKVKSKGAKASKETKATKDSAKISKKSKDAKVVAKVDSKKGLKEKAEKVEKTSKKEKEEKAAKRKEEKPFKKEKKDKVEKPAPEESKKGRPSALRKPEEKTQSSEDGKRRRISFKGAPAMLAYPASEAGSATMDANFRTPSPRRVMTSPPVSENSFEAFSALQTQAKHRGVTVEALMEQLSSEQLEKEVEQHMANLLTEKEGDGGDDDDDEEEEESGTATTGNDGALALALVKTSGTQPETSDLSSESSDSSSISDESDDDDEEEEAGDEDDEDDEAGGTEEDEEEEEDADETVETVMPEKPTESKGSKQEQEMQLVVAQQDAALVAKQEEIAKANSVLTSKSKGEAFIQKTSKVFPKTQRNEM